MHIALLKDSQFVVAFNMGAGGNAFLKRANFVAVVVLMTLKCRLEFDSLNCVHCTTPLQHLALNHWHTLAHTHSLPPPACLPSALSTPSSHVFAARSYTRKPPSSSHTAAAKPWLSMLLRCSAYHVSRPVDAFCACVQPNWARAPQRILSCTVVVAALCE